MMYGNIVQELQAIDTRFQANADLLRKVQALHAANEDTDYTPRCTECGVGYPCDTIQIIEGLI
jgi:hypothetical protein